MANISVKNIIGTSHNKCHCTNWLEHWEKFSGKHANFCSVYACMSKAKVGAHVRTDHSAIWYITPLCEKHSEQTTSYILSEGAVLVPANAKETCALKRSRLKAFIQRLFLRL